MSKRKDAREARLKEMAEMIAHTQAILATIDRMRARIKAKRQP